MTVTAKDKKLFKISVLMAVSILIVVAFFDFLQYPDKFYVFVYLAGAVASVFYYIFRKDISESIAIFGSMAIMYAFGLEDLVFYYIAPYMGGQIESYNHLLNHYIIGNIASIFGFADITITVLWISVAIGLVITYFSIQFLRKINFKVGGLKI